MENRAEWLRGGFVRFFVWAVGEDCGDGDLVFCEEFLFFVKRIYVYGS